MKEEIQRLAPNLRKKDLNDLVKLAAAPDGEAKLRKILTDYKVAKKLNEPEINEWWKFLESIKPLMKVIEVVTSL